LRRQWDFRNLIATPISYISIENDISILSARLGIAIANELNVCSNVFRKKLMFFIMEASMTLSIALSVFALTAVCLFMWKKNNDNSDQLLDSRAYLKTLGVQIICGNCAGEGELPVRTFLDIHGTCSQCAGTSYVPASTIGVYTLLAKQAQMYGNQSPLYEMATSLDSNNGRVVSLKDHLATRGERVEKLAS
jgi:hypothetical protein